MRNGHDGAGLGLNGGVPEKKKATRSSIACTHCRRSKVKCLNDGHGAPCEACKKAKGRECEYPTQLPNPGKRSDSGPAIKQENEGESRKRPRKVEDGGRRYSEKPNTDPLDSPILTKKVWDDLFDIFKLHFSTEMPFLHPVSFRKRLRAAAYPREQAAIPEPDRMLLLGLLALTARFHPELVAHHSERGEPMVASEYYANALSAVVGSIPVVMIRPSLERIQALLMLSLYAWGHSYGSSAWQYLGIAIRLAQSMKLEYEDDPAEQALRNGRDVSGGKLASSFATDKEVRRRTLWSCFIMDRSLSGGKTSPSGMDKERLHVYLPCSENNFHFVADVTTGFLDTEWSRSIDSARRQLVNDDGVLSRHVRLKEIFGRCAAWSYPGGRRNERYPPWDSRSTVYGLQKDLEDFHKSLPSNLVFSQSNLSANIELHNSTPYASMHVLYLLCLIMLHREYIPYIAFECRDGPEGPIDEPTFPRNLVPEDFWEASAESIFSAAKEIISIVTTCQESDALPESPLFVFAVYQASYIALYAYFFPAMDVKSYVSCPRDVFKREIPDKDYMEPTNRILRNFATRSLMAKFYVAFLKNNRRSFDRELAYFTKHGKTEKNRGGLGLYIEIEKDHKEFGGRPEDSERNIPSDGSDIADHPPSRGSTNEYHSNSFSGEAGSHNETLNLSRPSPWAAVNQPVAPSRDDRQAYHTQSPIFQSSPRPPSKAPSLISPGESTPSVQSPYTAHQTQFYHPVPQHTATYSAAVQGPIMPAESYAELETYESDLKSQGNIVINSHGSFDNFAQNTYGYDYQQFADVQSGGDEQYNPMLQPGFAFVGQPMHGMY